jgi:hypothetical protein
MNLGCDLHWKFFIKPEIFFGAFRGSLEIFLGMVSLNHAFIFK